MTTNVGHSFRRCRRTSRACRADMPRRAPCRQRDGRHPGMPPTSRKVRSRRRPGLSIESFASMIKGSIDAITPCTELALKTGQTVEALSSLQPWRGAPAPTWSSSPPGCQKLSKNMLEAARPARARRPPRSSPGHRASSTRRQSCATTSRDQEVAEKPTRWRTKTQRWPGAADLRQARRAAAPFLHELSAAGELHARITTEQAERAHHFHSS